MTVNFNFVIELSASVCGESAVSLFRPGWGDLAWGLFRGILYITRSIWGNNMTIYNTIGET